MEVDIEGDSDGSSHGKGERGGDNSDDEDEKDYEVETGEDDEEDKDDEDGDHSQSVRQILRTKTSTNKRHVWLTDFHSYLQSLAGKGFSNKQAEQHVSQLNIVLNCIDPQGKDITAITDSKREAVWKWAKPLLDKKQKRQGTIISYLTSLEKFSNSPSASRMRLTKG